ncbi:MAG: sugar phosphate isomerase/epimerase, partial [Ornithinimicrobium sp.]
MDNSRPPIGCHALVWTGTFDRQGIVDSVRRTGRAGFDLVEFPLMEPKSFDSATARRALDDEGLAVTSSLGLPTHADISSDEPDAVAAGRELLT